MKSRKSLGNLNSRMAPFAAANLCRICKTNCEIQYSVWDFVEDRMIAELMRKFLDLEVSTFFSSQSLRFFISVFRQIHGFESQFICCECLNILKDANKLRRIALYHNQGFDRRMPPPPPPGFTAIHGNVFTSTPDREPHLVFESICLREDPSVLRRAVVKPWQFADVTVADHNGHCSESSSEADAIIQVHLDTDSSEEVASEEAGRVIESEMPRCKSINSIELPDYQNFRASTSSSDSSAEDEVSGNYGRNYYEQGETTPDYQSSAYYARDSQNGQTISVVFDEEASAIYNGEPIQTNCDTRRAPDDSDEDEIAFFIALGN